MKCAATRGVPVYKQSCLQPITINTLLKKMFQDPLINKPQQQRVARSTEKPPDEKMIQL